MAEEQQDPSVGARVRLHTGTDGESLGMVVDDYGEIPSSQIDMGEGRVVSAARRWAVIRDDGTLVFVDDHELAVE